MPQATMIQTPTPSIRMEVPAEFAEWLAYQDSDERKAAAAAQALLPPTLQPEYEMPPPIPDHLRDRDCAYGYILTDALIQTHFDAHLQRLGIEVYFGWQALRKGPSEKRLKMFTDALGFAEPQWIEF
ncbi:hypothetical protein C8R47DRAFT_1224514 [Mycena vitilis]|nr:hypothetical protein C8R47DRAFT_1224514 [Mycena vitilis]